MSLLYYIELHKIVKLNQIFNKIHISFKYFKIKITIKVNPIRGVIILITATLQDIITNKTTRHMKKLKNKCNRAKK